MNVAERRRSYRRVQYVAARELVRGNIVCSDDGPWKVVDVIVCDGRVVLASHTGWRFGCDAETRFKVKVTEVAS